MLTREELIKLAVDDYFKGCNAHDNDKVTGTFSEDCLMHFPAAQFKYQGKAHLIEHFEDFLDSFPVIHFHDFTNIVDEQSQSIVSYFNIHLTDDDGEQVKMRNCNIFHCDEQGLFKEIVIYNTAALDKGFHAGNS